MTIQALQKFLEEFERFTEANQLALSTIFDPETQLLGNRKQATLDEKLFRSLNKGNELASAMASALNNFENNPTERNLEKTRQLFELKLTPQAARYCNDMLDLHEKTIVPLLENAVAKGSTLHTPPGIHANKNTVKNSQLYVEIPETSAQALQTYFEQKQVMDDTGFLHHRKTATVASYK